MKQRNLRKNLAALAVLALSAATNVNAQDAEHPQEARQIRREVRQAQSPAEIRRTHPAGMLEKETPDIQLRAEATATPWPDSTVTFSAAGQKQSKSAYIYDEKGYQTQYNYFEWKDGQWVNSSKTVYTNNAQGKTTLSESFRWENSQWVNSRKTSYEYDAAGKETLYESYSWKDNAWAASYKTVQNYDAKGRRTLYESYTGANNAWTGSSKYTYEYDALGNDSRQVTYKWSGNKWNMSRDDRYEKKTLNPAIYVHTLTRYDYDNPSGWLHEGTSLWIGGGYNWAAVYEKTFKQEYKATYDSKNYLTQVETTVLSDGKRAPDTKFVIKYTSNRPVSVEEYSIWNGASTLHSKATYQYDSKGNVTLFEDTSVGQDPAYTDARKNVYAYDAKGNKTLEENYTYDRNVQKLVGTWKETATYNSDGKQTSYEYYYEYDAASGKWIGSSKRTNDKWNENGDVYIYSDYEWTAGQFTKTDYTVRYPNPDESGNVAVNASAAVWSAGGTLYVRADRDLTLFVYTSGGALFMQQSVGAGETAVALPQGAYIVKAGDAARKVIVQ